MFTHNPLYILYFAALIIFLIYISAHLTSPLRSISGPFLARFTRFWHLLNISRGNFEKTTLSLHRKYGKIVRISPNQYSFSDPDVISTIYNNRENTFCKSDFYDPWAAPGIPNLFTQRDESIHARNRKKFHSAYTMSAMTRYEKYVDDCVGILCKRMDEMKQEGKFVDMAWWLQCFAFDVIGTISYSKRFGFLDRGEDQSDLIGTIHRSTRYSLSMGVVPEWHRICFNVLNVLGRLGFGTGAGKQYLRDFTMKSKREREDELEKRQQKEKSVTDADDKASKDFMTSFIEHHKLDPNTFTLNDVINGVQGNIAAGSDTTGIALSAILYFLVSHPRTLQKLREEIDQPGISDPITFKEAQSLEFFQAIIKEAMRLHPSIGALLPRTVPIGGVTIARQFFPAGTVVSINPYVVHRDEEVFEDAELFRPERWLKSETDPGKLERMNRALCPFGAGSRTCIGKNVSLLEICKVIPQLVRKFDFEISEELRIEGLKSKGEWFVQIVNLRMRLRERG